MRLACMFGRHSWAGCKCTACGTKRDKGHDWSQNCERCAICGMTRSGAHTWNGCKCCACRQTRDAGHDYSQNCERCAICGSVRGYRAHKWNGCVCSECGATRDDQHVWDGGVCGICGTPKWNERVWAEQLAMDGNCAELARVVDLTWYLGRDDRRTQCAQEVICAAGDAAAESLVGLLPTTSKTHRGDGATFAMHMLASIGVSAIPPLVEALQDDNPFKRVAAASVLVRTGDVPTVDHAVSSLVSALGDEDAVVREEAVAGFEELRDARAVEALLVALGQDESGRVRLAAASALGNIGDRRAVQGLTAALGDGYTEEDYNTENPLDSWTVWPVRNAARNALDKIEWRARQRSQESS
jgi:hypothetical protein